MYPPFNKMLEDGLTGFTTQTEDIDYIISNSLREDQNKYFQSLGNILHSCVISLRDYLVSISLSL